LEDLRLHRRRHDQARLGGALGKKRITACDRLGMVVVLGLFYGKQSGTFKDEAAVKAAVTNTVDWLLEKKATNVLIEIGNESISEGVWPIPSSPPALPLRADRAGAEAQRRQAPGSHSLIGIDARRRATLAVAGLPAAHGNRVYGPDGHFQPSPHGIRLQSAMARRQGLPRQARWSTTRTITSGIRQGRQTISLPRRGGRELGLLRLTA